MNSNLIDTYILYTIFISDNYRWRKKKKAFNIYSRK